MPRVEARVVVKVPSEVAFAVSQTTGDIRYRWDPFVREQHISVTHSPVTPTWLRPIAHPVGAWLLGREIRRRIAGFARGCADPVVAATR